MIRPVVRPAARPAARRVGRRLLLAVSAALCAVLRSWEDRFGLRLVALGSDTLTATVAAPPRTPEEAEAIAAEHFAFCPDNITQGHFETLRDYAHKALLAKPTWHFWWD